MAVGTQSNQVVQVVVSECTVKADVVNFEVSRPPALLTSPPISFEYPSAEDSIGIGSSLTLGRRGAINLRRIRAWPRGIFATACGENTRDRHRVNAG
jgi:hypothetical protein